MYRYIWCLYRYITLQFGQTLSHVSIHARMLRYMLAENWLVSIQTRVCIDTNTWKHLLWINFHSFIKHQNLLLLHEKHSQNPHSQIFNLPQIQPKLTKLDPKPLQIHYPFTFLHQFHGSSFIISTFKNKGFSILGLWILQVFKHSTR